MIAMAVHGMNLAFIDILMPYIDELVIAPLNPEKVKIANYIWYPFWSTFYVFAIYSVHYIHKMLNISDTGVSKMLSASYLALLCLQAVGYFDALYFYSDELALVYHFGVPAVNIGLGFYLFLRLKDRKETYDAVNRPVDG